MRYRFATAGIVSLLAMLPSCLGGSDGVPGSGAIRVTGRLVDSETGEPVSRETFYVHAFNDSTGERASLEPGEGSDFALNVAEPRIRLRIPDLENKYELYEETLLAEAGVLDVEVRLKPTHWVRLHGHVLWKDDASRLRPLKSYARISAGRIPVDPDTDGAYSVLVPRERMPIRATKTGSPLFPKEVDLQGYLGEEYQLDIIFDRKP